VAYALAEAPYDFLDCISGRSNRTLSAWSLRELDDKCGRFLHRDFEVSPIDSLRSVLIVETFQNHLCHSSRIRNVPETMSITIKKSGEIRLCETPNGIIELRGIESESESLGELRDGKKL